MLDAQMDSSNKDHDYSESSSKKIIKPTKSINDLLNFESDSDLAEQLTVTPTTEADDSFHYEPNYKMMHDELEKELNKSDSRMSKEESTIENLSIEEIGHIRLSILYVILTVLYIAPFSRRAHVKADIEALPLEGTIRSDILKSKICFQCLKTRFNLFRRARRCNLCLQAVCGKCLRKMSVTPFLTPSQQRPTKAATEITARPGTVVRVCEDCRLMMIELIRPGERAKDRARKVWMKSLVEETSKTRGLT